jgi:hypothetical protein
MSFFEDLSAYDYLPMLCEVSSPARNVGWLESGQSYPRGPVQPWVVDALWAHCRYIVGPTRGFFDCPFCSGEPVCSYVHDGERRMLGTGEIRIFSLDGSAFASPNLVFHYVRDHSYQLPDVVVTALRDGPKPGSPEYERRLNDCGLYWRNHPPIAAEPRRIRL